MADHLSEEEQIEVLKNWWSTYWKSVVLPIVAVGLGYLGWNYYSDAKLAKAQAGGATFQALLQNMQKAPGEPLSDEERAAAKTMASDVVANYSGTLYGDHSLLILAKLAVEEGEYQQAAGYLTKVVEDGENKAIRELAKARLARVELALGNSDKALDLVASTETEYKNLYAEIRGDVLVEQGKGRAAATAYQEALDALPPMDIQRRSVLQFKIDGAEILAEKFANPASTQTMGDDTSGVDAEQTPADASTETVEAEQS